MKCCRHCGESKVAGEFNKNSSATDGLQSWCRDCFKQYNRSFERGPRPPDRHLRDRYGISLVERDERLAEQEGRCAICGSEFPNGPNWHIDHDHNCCPGRRTCGRCVRGVLCAPCNQNLGRYEKGLPLMISPDWIASADHYLKGR